MLFRSIMPGLPAVHPQQGELTTSPSDINALPPTSINAPQQSSVGSADQIASAIVQAMRDNKAEVELTIIDSRTGERQVMDSSWKLLPFHFDSRQ